MKSRLSAVVAWLALGGWSLPTGLAFADELPKAPTGWQPATTDPALQPPNAIQLAGGKEKVPDPKVIDISTLPERAAGNDPAPPIFAVASQSRFFASADYLMWWVKNAPLPIPIVATLTGTGQNGNDKAFIGDPATSVIYGNGSQSFQTFSGLRAGLGMWLDDDQSFGIEGSGFMLAKRSAGLRASTDSAGNPNFDIPFYNSIGFNGGPYDKSPSENSFPIGQPGDIVGTLNIQNTLRLWGAEVNGVVALFRGPSWQVYGSAGFRYLDLYETFALEASLVGIGTYAGSSGATFDFFQTRNQFYGGNLGLRGHYEAGAFSVDVTGKVAMGASHEVLNVRGYYLDQGYSQTPTANHGIFAQPANSGNFIGNDFAVVPEANLKLAYDLRPWSRITAGYDFLYVSRVVRPGDQLSHYLPKGQIFSEGGSAVSTTSPAPQFNKTDFFAHGLNFGMSFRY